MPPRESKGLNLLIYPSALLSSGRLGKIANSLQASGEFDETQIVGIDDGSEQRSGELARGVRVVRMPGAQLSDVLGGIRMMLFWPLRVYRHYRRQRLRAVSAQNVYLLPLAYHLARKTGAIFVYNAHELETETIGAKGFKQKIAKYLERRYIQHADVVSVVNDSIAEWYSAHYEGVQPVVLTNTPIDDGTSVDLRGLLEVPNDELLYIHVGFLMEGRNIPLLLETFSAHATAHLAFLGDGLLRPEVAAAAAEFPNIHLLDTVPPESVVGVVRGADVGICLIEYVSLSDKLSTPNKLMEALAAGIPPLTSDLIEARRLLGPQLSDAWILESPAEQLGAALERIGPQDIVRFRKQWQGIPSWDGQAVRLVEAYTEAFSNRGLS